MAFSASRPAQAVVEVADRCGLVASWTSAVLDGRASPDAAAAVLADRGGPLAGTGDASAHPLLEEWFDLSTPEGPCDDQAGLAGLLAHCRRTGVVRLWCAPTAAGDSAMLPGPPDFNAAAVDAGGAVLLGGTGHGLVPGLSEHGPAGDRVRVLRWQLRSCRPRPHGEVPPGPTLAEADRALLDRLNDAVAALRALDVAAFDPRSDGIRHAGERSLLPPGTPARAEVVRRRALVVLHAVAVAAMSEGAAVSASAMAARVAALRPAAHAARDALAAAWNAAALTHDRSGVTAQSRPGAAAVRWGSR